MSEKEGSWPQDMDAEERVRQVALTRTTSRNAGWIATEADVSRDTAAKYLSRMADRGELETVETGEGICYRPDGVSQFLKEVRELAEEHSLGDLTAELREIGDEIDRWKREYDVDSLAELRESVGNDDLTERQRRERVEVVEEWEYDIEMREAIRLAITLEESLSEVEAETDAGSSTYRPPQEG